METEVPIHQPVSVSTASLLIVDDNSMNRIMLSRYTMRLGYQSTLVENGRQALEKLQNESFDLVLLDVQMPEMDGYQVLEQMKTHPYLREIPVIMISAVDELESTVKCIELGAQDYLPKPFSPVLLRARIAACLERKWLRDQEIDCSDRRDDRVRPDDQGFWQRGALEGGVRGHRQGAGRRLGLGAAHLVAARQAAGQ